MARHQTPRPWRSWALVGLAVAAAVTGAAMWLPGSDASDSGPARALSALRQTTAPAPNNGARSVNSAVPTGNPPASTTFPRQDAV